MIEWDQRFLDRAEDYLILGVCCAVAILGILGPNRPVLVRRLHNGLAGNTLPHAMAVAIHASQSVHRDNFSGRRAGNDGLVGPGVDWEVRSGLCFGAYSTSRLSPVASCASGLAYVQYTAFAPWQIQFNPSVEQQW